ncbi:MAG: hypothetical protein MGG11_02855 [Trichodesmium sp. MAG_R03]|nr:hypothetical protein [Trichodesmium sp. MAG_R03]
MVFLKGTNKKDNLKGTAKKDFINGKGGNDKINGGGGNDKINGGAGKDILNGGGGNDKINGGGGNDKINGGAGKDILNGGGGNDKINGGGGNDQLNGSEGKDTLNGGNAQDNLIGGSGNDFLDGGKGNDILTGNSGNDVLVGNFGKDILTGGTGDDVFFLKQNSAVDKKSAADIITDFKPNFDSIGLDNGLTENNLNLQLSGDSTVIKVKQTGKILGIVKGVKPKDLKWNFTSINGKPNVIENRVTFKAPTVQLKSSNDYADFYEMKLTGSDKSSFTINIINTPTEAYPESVRYTPSPSEKRKGQKPFTAEINSEGDRIELKFDGASESYVLDNNFRDIVIISKRTAQGAKEIARVDVDEEVSSDVEQSVTQALCKAGQDICKGIEIMGNVATGLAGLTVLTAPTGVGAVVSGALGAVALGAKAFGYGCLMLYGNDSSLVNTLIDEASGSILRGIGKRLFKTVAGQTRKQVRQVINKKYDQDFFQPAVAVGKNPFKDMEDFYLGKKGEKLGTKTYDFVSSILKTSTLIANKKSNTKKPRDLMQKIRESLGLYACDKKEVEVYFQPDGNPWALTKLYLVSPEEKFIGTPPNSISGLNNDAGKWVSVGAFPIGTELEFETRVGRNSFDRGITDLAGGLTLSSKSPESASINTFPWGLVSLGFEDGSSGKWLGIDVEKPNDFNDTEVNITNVIVNGNDIFVG